MNIRFLAGVGWEIQIVDNVGEADTGFYILKEKLPALIAYVKREFGGKVSDTQQAKWLMHLEFIQLK
jgi:hypothetical protein